MSNAISALQAEPVETTRFEAADLTIRNRVLTLKAAMDAVPAAAPVRDELMITFGREVEDLQAQLGMVESQFGKGTPMARVLREALESARCRLETRRIELAVDEKVEAKPQLQIVPNKTTDAERNNYLWILAALAFTGWNWAQPQLFPAPLTPVGMAASRR